MDKDYIKQLEEENAGLKRVRDKIMPKLTRQINKDITAMEYLIEENNKLKKVIEIFKRFEIDLKDYCNGHYSMEILYDTCRLTKEQFEILNEVLGHED